MQLLPTVAAFGTLGRFHTVSSDYMSGADPSEWHRRMYAEFWPSSGSAPAVLLHHPAVPDDVEVDVALVEDCDRADVPPHLGLRRLWKLGDDFPRTDEHSGGGRETGTSSDPDEHSGGRPKTGTPSDARPPGESDAETGTSSEPDEHSGDYDGRFTDDARRGQRAPWSAPEVAVTDDGHFGLMWGHPPRSSRRWTKRERRRRLFRDALGARARKSVPDGNRSVLVLLPTFADAPAEFNVDEIRTSLWSSARLVFSESSRGRIDLPERLGAIATVSLGVSIADFDTCDYTGYTSTILGNWDALTGSGPLNFTGADVPASVAPWWFEHVVTFLPFASGCTWAGVAYLPGMYAWMRTSSASIIAHELG